MSLPKYFRRYVFVRFLTPDPDATLSVLAEAGIEFFDIQYVDALTVHMRVAAKDYSDIVKVLKSHGVDSEIIKRTGLLWSVLGLYRRPVLVVSLLLLCFAALWIPGRILRVQVQGNANIPERYLLLAARECGIRFGGKTKTVRSEQVKNSLLQKFPALQWVGVNTEGSVVTILVRERSAVEEASMGKVCSIVAAHDGLICSMSVEQGNPLCQEGQQVKKGDILISGYTDCGLKIRAEKAEGEIYAYTQRENTVVGIHPMRRNGEILKSGHNYRLRIGKKVINLYNDSGISDGTCVKMYVEEFWPLSGGFVLPISLIRETWTLYDLLPPQQAPTQEESWIPQFAQEYTLRQMIAGEILEMEQHIQTEEHGFSMTGMYYCREMIGQVKYEETLEEDAQNH